MEVDYTFHTQRSLWSDKVETAIATSFTSNFAVHLGTADVLGISLTRPFC